MPRPRNLFALIIATLVTAGLALADSSPRSIVSAPVPAQTSGLTAHIAQLDGPVTAITGPLGRSVAVWAYRAQGEFDIAISVREAGATTWGSPTFFGRRNGFDDLDPALVFDADGTAYVAFTTAAPSRIEVSALQPTATVWSAPVVVSGNNIASSPALMMSGENLVVGFRTVPGTRLVMIPVTSVTNQNNGIHDGPDGWDTGVKGKTSGSDSYPVAPPVP